MSTRKNGSQVKSQKKSTKHLGLGDVGRGVGTKHIGTKGYATMNDETMAMAMMMNGNDGVG